MRQYIIAVSEKGITRDKEDDFEILSLGRIFGYVESFTHSPWFLTDDRSYEKTYRAARPDGNPLEPEEVQKTKEAFEKKNKILKIYELIEVE